MGKKSKNKAADSNKKNYGKELKGKEGKSKVSKGREAKKSYVDWFYMCDKELSVRDIYSVIKDSSDCKNMEFWEEAGVIEIEIGEKSSIDIEQLKMFRGESDKAFIEEYNVKNIFGLKTDSDHAEVMKRIFDKVVGSLGGFVCSDSDDFKPFICEGKM